LQLLDCPPQIPGGQYSFYQTAHLICNTNTQYITTIWHRQEPYNLHNCTTISAGVFNPLKFALSHEEEEEDVQKHAKTATLLVIKRWG